MYGLSACSRLYSNTSCQTTRQMRMPTGCDPLLHLALEEEGRYYRAACGTWPAVRAECQALGGDLVNVHSAAKNNATIAFMNSFAAGWSCGGGGGQASSYAWIGAYCSVADASCQWVDGSAWSSSFNAITASHLMYDTQTFEWETQDGATVSAYGICEFPKKMSLFTSTPAEWFLHDNKCEENGGVSSSDGAVCCSASCGTCGGAGCSGRTGGAWACCAGDIINNGKPCGSPPCILSGIADARPNCMDRASAFNAYCQRNDTQTSFGPNPKWAFLQPASRSGARDNWFRGGALAKDGSIVFAPHNADIIGIFNASRIFNASSGSGDDSADFSAIDLPRSLSGLGKFDGAVLGADGRIYFVPFHADVVGVLETSPVSLSVSRRTFVSINISSVISPR